jgi:mannose-6-phosphate isomerase-like protein (cupin superfamily)
MDHPWGPPQLAFDISKADVDTLLKNAPPGVDQMLRVVDMGKYTDEVYIVLSGGGILTTGTPGDRKPAADTAS